MKVLVSLLTAVSILTSFVPRTLPYPYYVEINVGNGLGYGWSNINYNTDYVKSTTHFTGSGSVQIFSTSYYCAIGWSNMIYSETASSADAGVNKSVSTEFDYADTIFEPVQIISSHSITSYGQSRTVYTADGT